MITTRFNWELDSKRKFLFNRYGSICRDDLVWHFQAKYFNDVWTRLLGSTSWFSEEFSSRATVTPRRFELNDIHTIYNEGNPVRDGSALATTDLGSRTIALNVQNYSPAPAQLSPCSLLRMTAQLAKQYRDKTAEVIFGRRPIVPWMKWREIELVQEILTRLQPGKCLECGSAALDDHSTRY